MLVGIHVACNLEVKVFGLDILQVDDLTEARLRRPTVHHRYDMIDVVLRKTTPMTFALKSIRRMHKEHLALVFPVPLENHPYRRNTGMHKGSIRKVNHGAKDVRANDGFADGTLFKIQSAVLKHHFMYLGARTKLSGIPTERRLMIFVELPLNFDG